MLRLSQNKEVLMTRKELCRSVAFRLAKVDHDLDEHQILKKAKRAVKVLRNV